MSIVLHSGSGAGDFSLHDLSSSDHLAQYKHNVSGLLQIRGHRLALNLFTQLPWVLRNASNWFNDEFSVLHATVGLEQYEHVRTFPESPEHRLAFRQIADTIMEIGPYTRFIAVALDPNRKPEPSDPRSLTEREINKLVYKYIGVNGGYLGDFSYRTHHDFYGDLDLDIDPTSYPVQLGRDSSRFSQEPYRMCRLESFRVF